MYNAQNEKEIGVSFKLDTEEHKILNDLIKKENKKGIREYIVWLLKKENNNNLSSNNNQIGNFLLKSDIDPETTYNYLRTNPHASKFIYKKYEKLRPIISEICDPDNPLYLEEVKNELSGIVEVKNEENKLDKLKEEQNKVLEQTAKYKDEEYKLKSEIKELEAQWEEWDSKLEEVNKRREQLDKEVGNLEEPEVLKKIKSFNDSFTALIKSIFSNNIKPENTNNLLRHEITLTSDQNNTLKLLSEQAEEIKKLIEKEDMLSEFKLSEKRQALKEQIEKEKENAKKEMGAFMIHNPEKMLSKIKDHINLSLDRIKGVREDSTSGFRSYSSHEFGTITSELDDAILKIDILSGQVENKSRWGKLKGE
jgi:hypothetical protein